jgi:hypothetical protein
MSNTTSTVDEVWAWIYQPLQDLKQDRIAEPDKPWETSRALFLSQLGLADSAEHPVAHLLIHRLEELPEAQRADILSADELETLAYEVVQQCTAETTDQAHATDPRVAAYDEKAWQEYLTKNLPAWDGSAQSWAAFKEWFVYYAADQGLSSPANALVDHVDGMSNDDRVATLAQYGLAVKPAGEASQSGPPLDESATTLMAEILNGNPEFAAIPEERRRQLMAEVLQEQPADAD